MDGYSHQSAVAQDTGVAITLSLIPEPAAATLVSSPLSAPSHSPAVGIPCRSSTRHQLGYDVRLKHTGESIMNRPLPAASVRVPFAAAMCIALAYVTAAHAVPVFYVSTQDAGAVPGLFDLTGVPYSSTGTIHIWARSDVRLSGVSLDLIETGGAIKFTGFEIPNPNDRWAFVDGPQIVTNSAVTNIGGAAFPLIAGHGIGPGSLEGNDVLLASVNYLGIGGSVSQLALASGKQRHCRLRWQLPVTAFRNRRMLRF